MGTKIKFLEDLIRMRDKDLKSLSSVLGGKDIPKDKLNWMIEQTERLVGEDALEGRGLAGAPGMRKLTEDILSTNKIASKEAKRIAKTKVKKEKEKLTLGDYATTEPPKGKSGKRSAKGSAKGRGRYRGLAKKSVKLSPSFDRVIPKRLKNTEFNDRLNMAAGRGDKYAMRMRDLLSAAEEQSNSGPLFFRPIYNRRGRQIIIARNNGPNLYFNMDNTSDLFELAKFSSYAGLDLSQMIGWSKNNGRSLNAQMSEAPGSKVVIGDLSFRPEEKSDLGQLVRETMAEEAKGTSMGGGEVTATLGESVSGSQGNWKVHERMPQGGKLSLFDREGFLSAVRRESPELAEKMMGSASPLNVMMQKPKVGGVDSIAARNKAAAAQDYDDGLGELDF